MLLRLVLSTVALLIVAYVVPGIHVTGIVSAVIAAVVIGVVNATVGLVLKVVTFPLTVLTLGLFWFVINALMLMLASAIVPGFQVSGFVPALIGSILLSIVNTVLGALFVEKQESHRS